MTREPEEEQVESANIFFFLTSTIKQAQRPAKIDSGSGVVDARPQNTDDG